MLALDWHDKCVAFSLSSAQFLFFKRPKQIDLKIVSADKGHIHALVFVE